MTIEEALKTDRQLILTIESPDDSPPSTVVMAQPYCLTQDGYLYGSLDGEVDWRVPTEFISKVELGAPIEESMK